MDAHPFAKLHRRIITMNTTPNHEPPPWGIKVNTHRSGQQKRDCPPWANGFQREKWGEAGVVIWDHDQQQITRLHAGHALDILQLLRTTDDWRQEGIIVGEPAVRIKLRNQTRTRRRKGEEPPPDEPEEKPQHVLTNTIHLTAERAHELLDVLQRYENELRPIAEADDKAANEAIFKAHGILLGFVRAKESKDIDVAARPVPWTFDEASLTWTCNLPPNRVTVAGAMNNIFWQGCLERPHQFKQTSQHFAKLEQALAWAEQAIQTVEAVPSPKAARPKRQRLTIATLTATQRERLAPFWIEPSALEPARITYRVLIEVEHVPISRKAFDLSFGEKMYYGEKYPTALQLARKLNLDPDRVDVEELFRGLFQLTSLTTYREASTAKEQANWLWEQSAIVAAHRAGQIIRAAYGIVEVETRYDTLIGWCGDWPDRTTDRESFMAEQAFQLTLAHSLNVDDYRAYLGLSDDHASDAKLLLWMHEARAESTVIPQAEREISRQWLKEHA
jgi:hypothetical protein